MHELSVAQNIINIVEENTKSSLIPKIKFIRIRVGKMSNILIDSLNFGFESLVYGTELEGAKLLVEETPVTILCKKCGKKIEIKEPMFSCINCGSNSIEVVAGTELFISELEIE